MTRTKTPRGAMARPLIMVDVDGVLNRLGKRVPDGWKRMHVEAEDQDGVWYRVVVNPDHGPMLMDLAAETGAQLAWCTFWEGRANEVIGPVLGLPKMPVIRIQRKLLWHESKPGIGQVKAVSAAFGSHGRPFVWFDDEPDAAFWLARHKRGPASAILTDPAQGLGERHIETARRWLLEQRDARERREGEEAA